MTWALQRQLFYIFAVVIFFSIVGFLIYYPSLNKAPTCSDGIQNGTEMGVDCGGSCARACLANTDQISVLWARTFKVVNGRYNAVAYLENHNQNTAVNSLSYRFRFADANNVYIGKRDGATTVPPSGKFAVFEPAIDIGNSIPVYVSFEFTQIPNWIQVSPDKIQQLKVNVSNINLQNETTSPRLTATIKNNSLFTIPEVSVVAILYGADGNAISTSRTYLDVLSLLQTQDLTFTWPEPFSTKVVAKEIIPIYNIFQVRLK